MAKFSFSQWLLYFIESFTHSFEWDDGNLEKSHKKHGITIEEIESCFQDDKILVLGIQTSPKCEENRYGIIGKAYNGKVVFVCFTVRFGKIRPISGRLTNRNERSIYEE